MADIVDSTDRDPKNLNGYIKVNFKDILAEPKGVESCDCTWKTSELCFDCSKNCCYMMLSGLFGLCAALFWGFQFACISFNHVWCVTPALNLLVINCSMVQKCFGNIVMCFLAPICETCGLMFSNITMKQEQV